MHTTAKRACLVAICLSAALTIWTLSAGRRQQQDPIAAPLHDTRQVPDLFSVHALLHSAGCLTWHFAQLHGVSQAWQSPARPRVPLARFLQDECSHLREEHEQLVQSLLLPWADTGIRREQLDHWPEHRFYLHNDSLYVGARTQHNGLVPSFLRLLEVRQTTSAVCSTN